MIPIDDLQSLKVLVTGASSGIGTAAAKALASCGAELCIHFNKNRAQADALANELSSTGTKVCVVGGDMTSERDVANISREAIAALGGIDCLINNAGAIERTAIDDVDDDVFDRVFDLNARSILRLVRHSSTALRDSNRASIINVGSIAGRNGGAAGSGIYAAAKATVHSLTRSLAKELASDGIRVNAVAPGVIKTPFHDATPEATLESMRGNIPLGRLGTPEECAWTFVFLASPKMSGYLTGQIIDVNGGLFMP